MNRLVAILIGALAIIGGVRAQTAPDAPSPRESAIEALQDLVAIAEYDRVAELLAHDPGLATARGKFGFSAMNVQDMHFDPRIFALLLKNGANVNDANNEGITLLHILAEPEYVPLLLEHGADLEARDVLGRTPLLVQMEEPESYDRVAALLAAGADPNVRGARGQTPLSLASEADASVDLIKLLHDHGAHLE